MTLANGQASGYTEAPTLQSAAGANGTASSTGAYAPNTHAALADETLSLDSASHSIGASRAALAGSSFADSDISAERNNTAFIDADATDSPRGFTDVTAGSTSAAVASQPGTNATGVHGVQLSNKPILGGEGTFTVQPMTSSQQQQTSATMPTTAAAGSRQAESEASQMGDSTAIEVGRSRAGTEALERGRAGVAADRGLQDERSLRATYSAGIAHCHLLSCIYV